jgi:hypothetical protein
VPNIPLDTGVFGCKTAGQLTCFEKVVPKSDNVRAANPARPTAPMNSRREMPEDGSCAPHLQRFNAYAVRTM